jgi:Cu2+-exporting ATPase
MAGSSILVVMNSLRLERLPDPVPPAGALQADTAADEARHELGALMIGGPAIEPA